MEQDVHAVNSWPSLPALAPAPTAEAALGPAFAQLQLEQKEGWAAADARRQRLQQLRAEVADAQQALAASADGEEGGREAAARACLAAQQAGLRAELAYLDQASRSAEEQAGAAAAQVQQVEERRAQVAALEQREAALDGTMRALCCADGQVMRQWRQGTWRAQEALEAGVLGQRQLLVQLGQQLLEAQQQELDAFRRQSAGGGAGGAGDCTPPCNKQCAVAASAATSTAQPAAATQAAAQLLDPLAHLKTAEHAAAVVAAAAEELQGLQPVRKQWAELPGAAGADLAQLQATAEELQQRCDALQAEGGSAALQQLAEAAAAAEEGTALVSAVRQAMTEHWAWPALTATPWVQRECRLAGRDVPCTVLFLLALRTCTQFHCKMHACLQLSHQAPDSCCTLPAGEGRTAEEWLRLLGDQLRLQRQRDALADNSNRRRAVAI